MSLQGTFRYGAAELKDAYNRNLGVALTLSIMFHLGLIALYVFSRDVAQAKPLRGAPRDTLIPWVPLPPARERVDLPPTTVPSVTRGMDGTGSDKIFGAPIPVPDALIDLDSHDIASMSDLQHSTPDGGGDGRLAGPTFGDGELGGSQIPLGKSVKVREKEKLPDYGVFVAAEEEATWDPADLQRRIIYPDVAIRAGAEGTVILSVLVDEQGHVARVVVEKSDYKVLEEAAIEAVKKTPFAPARMNAQPVATWVQVDVNFTLNN